MRYKQTKKTLNDNILVTLRSPKINDAEQFLNFFKTVCAETDYLIRYPEEITIMAKQEMEFIENIAQSDDDMMMACFLDDRIVGNCQISFKNALKTKHRASIALSILKEFWGLGLGTLMINEMLNVAKDRKIRQIELEYIDGNERGKQLYKKLGFIETGRRPNAYRFKEGTFADEVIMVKVLRQQI